MIERPNQELNLEILAEIGFRDRRSTIVPFGLKIESARPSLNVFFRETLQKTNN